MVFGVDMPTGKLTDCKWLGGVVMRRRGIDPSERCMQARAHCRAKDVPSTLFCYLSLLPLLTLEGPNNDNADALPIPII